jgi:hypothetical protein
MTGAKKSFRLELTKEQQALILQKTGMEATELELADNAVRTQTEPERVGNQPWSPPMPKQSLVLASAANCSQVHEASLQDKRERPGESARVFALNL